MLDIDTTQEAHAAIEGRAGGKVTTALTASFVSGDGQLLDRFVIVKSDEGSGAQHTKHGTAACGECVEEGV